MKIMKFIYDEIVNLSPHAPPEIGGIIGGNNSIISEYQFDIIQNENNNHCAYHPCTTNLNRIISEWVSRGIEFYGIFHTHVSGNDKLSLQDMRYIKKIILSMPDEISFLYFPLVFPQEKIVSFVAEKNSSDVFTKKEEIIYI